MAVSNEDVDLLARLIKSQDILEPLGKIVHEAGDMTAVIDRHVFGEETHINLPNLINRLHLLTSSAEQLMKTLADRQLSLRP